MKRKILFGTVAAGIMLVSAICAHRVLSGGDCLLDANIEALTQGETTTDGSWERVEIEYAGRTTYCCKKRPGVCGFLPCSDFGLSNYD